MSYTIKPFEDLDIIDDFLMNAVASDEEVGEEFSRLLISGLLQQKLDKIRINIQRVIPANTPSYRGIRLDVEISEYDETDEISFIKNIYDIEPNKRRNLHLPKHNRFYQAKIDSKNMRAGENDFIKLPNLYVITITNYDPFHYDYMMYTIRNQCKEVPELKYDDGLQFIYFNTTGTKGGNSSIKKLLNYIQNSTINNVTDEVTQKLHECINRVKVSPEVRMEYMTLEEKIFYERLEAKNEGKIEGKIESIIQILEELGTIPENISNQLYAENHSEQLAKWLKLAATVDSIEEFIEKM